MSPRDSVQSEPHPLTILRGGRVIDPARGVDEIGDLGIRGTTIVDLREVAPEALQQAKVIDVTGCIVCPGLIDAHVHTYGGIGPVPPDVLGVGCGVTAVLDAGSAGSSTIDDLVASVDSSRTTVFGILYVQSQGIGATGYKRNRSPREIGSVNVSDILDKAETFSGVVKGIKGTAQGEFGPGWVETVKTIARWAGRPAYFHLGSFGSETLAPGATPELFEQLDEGDIITHMYTAQPGHVLNADDHVYEEVLRAQARGVVFDIGFGRTGFAFRIAERAAEEGLVPDMISSDIQLGIRRGEVNSLLDVASALMYVGFSPEQLIPAMTSNVVRAFHLPEELGSLQPGTVADVSVIQIETGHFDFEDTIRETRSSDRRLTPRFVLKAGELIRCDPGAVSPANESYKVASDVPAAVDELSGESGQYLRRVADLLRLLDSWDPEALQSTLRRLALERGIAWKSALAAMNVALTGSARGPQLGWWLETLHERGFNVPERFEAVADRVA